MGVGQAEKMPTFVQNHPISIHILGEDDDVPLFGGTTVARATAGGLASDHIDVDGVLAEFEFIDAGFERIAYFLFEFVDVAVTVIVITVPRRGDVTPGRRILDF